MIQFRILILTFLLIGFQINETHASLFPQGESNDVETMKYKLKLGWFSIGSGTVSIEKNATWDQEPCLKLNAHAETIGLGSWLGNLDDDYTSWISAKTMRPIHNEKNVTTGNHRWEQWSEFDYDSMSVDVKVLDHRRDDPNRNWQVAMEQNTQDVLSTYLFFKKYDWSKVALTDSVMISTFYEKKLYYVGIQYMGQEIIEFDGKKIGVYRLHLLMPDHKNLKKEQPVIIWITSDQNQYPLLIQTKLPFLGKGRVELVELNGKEPLHGL